jgi:hypothetical protein
VWGREAEFTERSRGGSQRRCRGRIGIRASIVSPLWLPKTPNALKRLVFYD